MSAKNSPSLEAGEQSAVRQPDAQTSAVHVDHVVPAAEVKRLKDEPADNAAEHSASATESGDSANAETREIASPKGDWTTAYSDSRAVAVHDAVSELHDAEGATDAHRHGVAGQDADHQNETGVVERTETAIAEKVVEQDHTDTSDGNEISPGKNSLGKGMNSVACYAESIGESWRRSVEAIMEVARLCVEASERLTPQERRELVDRLPFSDTVFSKLTKIGKNERLQTPEVQRLLPPNWTIIYSLAALHKYELDQVIAARVVGPDMRRTDLDKWIREERGVSGKDLTTVETVQAAPPNQPVPADVANDSLKLGGDADQVNNTAELRSRLIAYADSPLDSKVRSDVADDVSVEEIEIVSPPTAPVADEEGSSDSVGLSPEDQRIFDELMTTWDALVAKYRVSSKDVQERFEAAVKLMKASIVS
jgi:hypothetical protein